MTKETDSTTADKNDLAQAADFGFEANVEQLLELMTHSVYSEKDVFLRELISNAADACEKLRYESLSDAKLAAVANAPLIKISLDKDNRTITIADNGIGMTRNDLISALGAIANSGTRAFLEKINKEKSENESGLIGRFGVGFYSAFMVAEKVDVATRRAGEELAWLWSSQGKGRYSISPLPLSDAPDYGTLVTIHLNKDSEEFLEPWRIEKIITEHSGAVSTPIDLISAPGEESKRIADGVALWTKPKSEITPEEYTDFYRQLSSQFDEPALTAHWRAEGRTEYTVLAFIPGSRPLDLFDPARKSKTKLYVRRVLISQVTDLLPAWLRFVRLVVDSADLPLNVSREVAQKSPELLAIGKAITSKLLQELTKICETDAEKFSSIWENFGAVIKEGLHEDPSRRDGIFSLARFASTKSDKKTRSLKDYVTDLKENQTAIYYITGEDAKRLATSPQIEGYRARGIEVLLLDDSVDAFWVTSALGFEGKPFKSVTQGLSDIDAIPLIEKSETKPVTSPDVDALVKALKETLAESIEDVRVSTRLTESAACLIASDQGLDRQLAKILSEHGQADLIRKPVLEINPTHAAIQTLGSLLRDKGQDAVQDRMHLLVDLARVADGELPQEPAVFTKRLAKLLALGS